MTLSALLADIAWTGERGISPFRLPAGAHTDDVAHLIALKLVFVNSNGNLGASIEKGRYPVERVRPWYRRPQ